MQIKNLIPLQINNYVLKETLNSGLKKNSKLSNNAKTKSNEIYYFYVK